MTFDKKREQITSAEKAGRLLDREGNDSELLALLNEVKQSEASGRLLRALAHDDAVLHSAMPADVPGRSMDRYLEVIDREFDKRSPQHLRRAQPFWSSPMVQIAAALVLMAGTFMTTSFWMQSRMDTAMVALAAHMETERMLLAKTIQETLETKVSGEPVYIGQDGAWSDVLTPVRTYKSKSGHWCREYTRQTTFSKRALTIRGTACRDENGTWTTVFAEPVSDKFAPDPGEAGI